MNALKYINLQLFLFQVKKPGLDEPQLWNSASKATSTTSDPGCCTGVLCYSKYMLEYFMQHHLTFVNTTPRIS